MLECTLHNGLPVNTVLNWFPGDTKDRYQNNLSSKKTKKRLQELGWIDTVIEYKFDSLGFRNDFDYDLTESYNLVLGCSISFGIGVKKEDIWYHHLLDKFPEKFYNASIPGGSFTSCVRTLIGLLQLGFKVNRIFTLSPGFDRYDVYQDSRWKSVAWWSDHHSNTKKLILEKKHLDLVYLINSLALQDLCSKNNIELINISTNRKDIDCLICSDLCGRDLEHPGVDFHKHIAEQMYIEYRKTLDERK